MRLNLTCESYQNRTGTSHRPLGTPGTVTSNSLEQLFPWPWVISLRASVDQESTKHLGRTPCSSPEFPFHSVFSPLVLYPEISSCSDFQLLNSGSVLGLLDFPFLLHCGKLKTVNGHNLWTYLACFLFLRDHCPFLSDVQCLQMFFYMFSLFSFLSFLFLKF